MISIRNIGKLGLICAVISTIFFVANCQNSRKDKSNNGPPHGMVHISIAGCTGYKIATLYFAKPSDSLFALLSTEMYSRILEDSVECLILQTDSLGKLDTDSIPVGLYNVFIRTSQITKPYIEDSFLVADITRPCEDVWIIGFRVANDSISYLTEFVNYGYASDPFTLPFEIRKWNENIGKK